MKMMTHFPRFLVMVAIALAAWPVGAGRAQAPAQNPLLLDSPRELVEALDFTGETVNGGSVRLSDLRGKVVFVNFWATWCVPCLLEMPAMDRLNRKLPPGQFKMLAINQAESREQVEAFARENQFSFELVLDPIGAIGSNYGANRLPITYIIDKRGMVIRRAIGPREWDGEAALELFRTLIRGADEPSPATARAR